MNRRDFLQTAGSVATGFAFSNQEHLVAEDMRWRTFEVTTQIVVLKPFGTTLVWVPAALISSTPYQRTLADTFHCEGSASKTVVDRTEALGMIVAEFPPGTKPVVTVTSRVATRDWAVDLSMRGKAPSASAAELKNYLQPTRLLPTDGIVKETADQITRTCTTDAGKARAIYEWIVENTYRNPKTRGCGIGDIARAAGLPARDVYGIRVAKSETGYKSLGTSSDNITKAQHCRAEVYLSEYGWVPVDPADMRKVMLEEPPGNRSLTDEMVKKACARLFGSWEMNWMAYNFAHDVALPGSSGKPLGFLMYPQAETAHGRIDCLDPVNFKYEITSREITPTRG